MLELLFDVSPTDEFDIHSGHHQGDPMFPFLFILAMEGFHVFIHRALHIGIFRGSSIGFCGLTVFHLMYVEITYS